MDSDVILSYSDSCAASVTETVRPFDERHCPWRSASSAWNGRTAIRPTAVQRPHGDRSSPSCANTRHSPVSPVCQSASGQANSGRDIAPTSRFPSTSLLALRWSWLPAACATARQQQSEGFAVEARRQVPKINGVTLRDARRCEQHPDLHAIADEPAGGQRRLQLRPPDLRPQAATVDVGNDGDRIRQLQLWTQCPKLISKRTAASSA